MRAVDGPELAPGQVLRLRRDRIRPFRGQPRQHFDQKALLELARSIRAIGQQVPITVRPVTGDPKHDYELIDGERRWRACAMIEQPTLLAWVRTDCDDLGDQFAASVIANFSREGHGLIEIAQAIRRMRERPALRNLAAAAQTAAVADIFGRSCAWVYLYEQLLALDPEVQALCSDALPEKKRLQFEVASALTALPKKDQREIAKTCTEGRTRLSSGAAKALIRKRLRKLKGGDDVPAVAPRRAWDTFNGFLHRLADELDRHLEMSITEVKRGFLARDDADRRLMIRTLDEVRAQLGELRQALGRLIGDVAAGRVGTRGGA